MASFKRKIIGYLLFLCFSVLFCFLSLFLSPSSIQLNTKVSLWKHRMQKNRLFSLLHLLTGAMWMWPFLKAYSNLSTQTSMADKRSLWFITGSSRYECVREWVSDIRGFCCCCYSRYFHERTTDPFQPTPEPVISGTSNLLAWASWTLAIWRIDSFLLFITGENRCITTHCCC